MPYQGIRQLYGMFAPKDLFFHSHMCRITLHGYTFVSKSFESFGCKAKGRWLLRFRKNLAKFLKRHFHFFDSKLIRIKTKAYGFKAIDFNVRQNFEISRKDSEFFWRQTFWNQIPQFWLQSGLQRGQWHDSGINYLDPHHVGLSPVGVTRQHDSKYTHDKSSYVSPELLSSDPCINPIQISFRLQASSFINSSTRTFSTPPIPRFFEASHLI